MKYDFNKTIERRGSNSVKWDATTEFFGAKDVLPMWVADMDFQTPPFVINAIQQQLNRAVLGYTFAGEEWYSSIISWLKKRHEWDVEAKSLTFVSGVVRGQAHALQCFTEASDKVMVMTPVYHPFFQVTKHLHRQVVFSPLHIENNQIDIDFNQFENDIKGCKMLILCNPHNPGGRVWTKEELQTIAHICHKNNVLVISDEIHADLTLPGYRHFPFTTVSAEAAEIGITLMAPSKTFNMPGVSSSFAIIENEQLNRQFQTFMQAGEFDQGNMFAYASTVAAYRQGEEWLEQAKAYIEDNIRFIEQYCNQYIPLVHPIRPEASFLVWLDCSALNLCHDALVDTFINKAHLALNDGEIFGAEGAGCMRLNVATARSVIADALEKLRLAL